MTSSMNEDLRQRLIRQMAGHLCAAKDLDLDDRDMCQMVLTPRYNLLTMDKCLDDARLMARIRLENDRRTKD